MSVRLGLQGLVFAGCLVVSLVILGVTVPVINHLAQGHEIEQARQDLLRSLSVIKRLVAPYRPYPQADLNGILTEIARELHVNLWLFSDKGKLIGESTDNPSSPESSEEPQRKTEFSDALSSGFGSEIRQLNGAGEKTLFAACRISQPESASWVLRASVPLSRIETNSVEFNESVLVSVLLSVLLSLIAARLISRAIKQPVGELSRTAQAIANGDLFRRIRRYHHHEIGELGHVFNRMADTIQEKIENVTEARDHLEAILRGMAEGVLVTDAQGRILFANKALRSLLELERDPAGCMPSEIIRNADLVSAIRQIRQGTPKLIRQIRILGPNPHHLEARVVRISQQDGPAGCVAVLRDNTEQIHTEQIRRDFVANVSHELRTPLTAIQGAAEVLLEGALNSPEDARRFVEMIQRQSARLKQLSQDLLDLSIIESGRKKPQSGPVLASELAEDIMSTMQEVAIKHEVQLEAHLHQENLQFQADQSQIAEALINLVDNAIKYSGKGGRVILSIQEKDDQVYLSVEDNGPGIEAEHLPRLFERFYRVDSNRSRQMGGTGLGLAIVKHLVQARGGRVTVESEPGVGSTFTIIIPRIERQEDS